MNTASSLQRVLVALCLSLFFSACGGSEKRPEEKLVEKAKAEEAAGSESGAAEDMKLKVAGQDGAVDAAEESAAPATWTYQGTLGPANWGSISPDYALCKNGEKQSPIDLKWKRPTGTKNLRFAFQEAAVELGNNGRFIEVLLPPGQTSILDEVQFDLRAIQFHTPSEHKFSGKEFPVELAFVHQDKKGRKAIVSVMLTPGKANAALNKILPKIPAQKGQKVQVEGEMFHPLALLPVNYNHYRYVGSETIPPCTEGVLRIVLNTPVEASKDQIAKLRSYYSGNRRPTQTSGKNQVELFYGQ